MAPKELKIRVTLFNEHSLLQLLDPFNPHSSAQIFKHLIREQFKFLKQLIRCLLEHYANLQAKLAWRQG